MSTPCDSDPIDCNGPSGPGDITGPCIPKSSCGTPPIDTRTCANLGSQGNVNTAVRLPSGGSKSINAMIREDSALSGLMAQLAKKNISPSLKLNIDADPGTWRGGEPASFAEPTLAQRIITWNTGEVEAAIRSDGQDPAQILFHEGDHDWYHNTFNTATLDPVMVVTIDGQDYRYTVYTVDSNGNTVPGPGYDGYEHALIDADEKKAYGNDTTGALQEALTGADNPPLAENIPGILADMRTASPVFKTGVKGQRPQAPDLTSTCPDPTSQLAAPSGNLVKITQ